MYAIISTTVYCNLTYTIHKHLLCTQNILVEQSTLIYSRSFHFCVWRIFLFSLFRFSAAFILQNVAWISPAWFVHHVFSNVNFVIFFGIFRSWSNENHRCNDDSVIEIYRATALFLSTPNRFQMFSSRFRLTGAQKTCTGIPRNYFDRLFHERIFICQKLSKSRLKLSTHRVPLELNILGSLSIYSLCLH